MKDFLPDDKKLITGSIAGTVAILLFLWFAYLPEYIKVSQLKRQIRDVEAQIEITQKMVGDMTRLNQIVAQMQKDLTSFENRLPGKEQVSSIVSELSNMAKASSVEVVSIKPTEPELFLDANNNAITLDRRPLKSFKIDLSLRGPYRSIAEYIKDIQENLNMLATIEEIDIRKNKDIAPQLEVRLIFTAYLIDRDGDKENRF